MGGFRQAGPTGIPQPVNEQSISHQPINQSRPPSRPASCAQSRHQSINHQSINQSRYGEDDDLEPGSPMHRINQPIDQPINQPIDQSTDHMVRIHDDPEIEPGIDQPINQSTDHHIDVEYVPHHTQQYNYNQTLDQPIDQPINQPIQQPINQQPANHPTQQPINQQPINQPKVVNLRDIRAEHGIPQNGHQSINQSTSHQQGIQMVSLAAHQPTNQSAVRTINHHPAPPARQTTNRRSTSRRRRNSHDRSVDPSINQSMPYPAPMFSKTRRSVIPNFRILSITNLIVIGCIAMMIVELVVGADRYDGAFVSDNSMGGPSIKTLYRLGGKWEPAIRNEGEGWRLLSAIWLHSGLLHIAMNLVTLIVVGYTCEQRFTWPVYLIIYLASGVLGNLWSCVTYAASVGVGASGAIFGIIGAQLAHLLYNFTLIENAFAELIMLLIVAVVGICLGFISQVSANMDTYAHLGGFLTGVALGFAITPFPVKRNIIIEGIVRTLGLAGTAALFVIFSLLLFVGDPKGPENVTNL